MRHTRCLYFQWLGGKRRGMGLFGTGLNRICAVVAASTAAEMAKLLRSALRQARTVELRLDWLSSDLERERSHSSHWRLRSGWQARRTFPLTFTAQYWFCRASNGRRLSPSPRA